MDWNKAIEFAQLVNAAYAIPPDNLANSAGKALIAGNTAYTVVTTIYANDLATDINPGRGNKKVSIGFICQAAGTGDVVIAIRGTEGIQEWINDAHFLLVTCPFLAGAGHTEDGFTAMYNSLRTGDAAGSPTVVNALATLPFPQPVSSVTICGHSLGGALVTLLALDLAANTNFRTLRSTPTPARAREIRRLRAPTTRWSRIHSVSPIDLTSCRSCLYPKITTMCSRFRS